MIDFCGTADLQFYSIGRLIAVFQRVC